MGLIYVADPFAPTGNGPGIVYVFPQRGIDPQPIAEIRDGIERPEGLAVDADGTLYVANNGDNTIKAYRAGEMRPSKIYQIPHPYMGVDDVAVGPDRTVYASGSSRKGFIAEFPKGSTQAGLVIKMNTDAIAVDAGNNLYAVLAASPAQVYVFSPGSTRGTSLDFTMGLSYGIAIDAQHHIVVADLGTQSIEIFAEGFQQPLRTITDGVVNPARLAFDARGNHLYVTVADDYSTCPTGACRIVVGYEYPRDRIFSAFFFASPVIVTGFAYGIALSPAVYH
jgi:DNA-binding beta-propeller fold protein YncE